MTKLFGFIVNSFFSFLLVTVLSLLVKGVHAGFTSTLFTCMIVCLVIMVLLWSISNHLWYVPQNKKECRDLYDDAKRVGRKGIVFVNVMLVVFVVLAVYLNVDGDLQKTYPDARDYLTDEMEVSEKTMAFADAMPNYVAGKLYIEGQSLYDASEIESDESLSEEDREKELDAIADTMESRLRSQKVDNVLFVVLVLVIGALQTLIIRCAQYHSLMRKLEEEAY